MSGFQATFLRFMPMHVGVQRNNNSGYAITARKDRSDLFAELGDN
jgi:hypothetical protein